MEGLRVPTLLGASIAFPEGVKQNNSSIIMVEDLPCKVNLNLHLEFMGFPENDQDYNFSFVLIDPEDRLVMQVPPVTFHLKCYPETPKGFYSMMFNLGSKDLLLEKEGLYKINFFFEGQMCGSRLLPVCKARSSKKSVGQKVVKSKIKPKADKIFSHKEILQ